MICIKLHTILGIQEILGRRTVELTIPQGSTVDTLISLMVNTWGSRMASYFVDSENDHHLPRIRILVNGQDIGFLKARETELREGDEVSVLPLAAGG